MRRSLPLVDRRRFLAALAALPALAQSPGGAPSARPRFSDHPFSLGVASGEPDSGGFALWTRLAPKPLEGGGMPADNVWVEWQVAADEAFNEVVAGGRTVAKPELAHSVHVEVGGLEPETWYFYRFRSGSEISPVGRARTAPAADRLLERVRFAFASCQHYETGYYTAFEHMAKDDLDLVVHLGDYIYENAGRDDRVRKHAGAEIHALDDYRNRLAQYKTDKDLQAAHQACPWLVVWDDHEVDNNYANGVSEEADVSVDDFLTRRAKAYQAYFEHMPLRLSAKPVGHDMQLYRRVPYGRLLDFQMLDTRQYRTDQPCGDKTGPECADVFDPRATILGERQERWLYDALEQSPALWNVMAQQVLVARVDVGSGDEEAYSMDKWSAYRAMLDRFLKFLDERGPSNPVILTGDIHSNWACDVLSDYWRSEQARPVASEFVGTSISSGGDGSQDAERAERFKDRNPWVKFFNRERGYVRCEVTPEQWRSDYQVVEYVSKPGAPLKTRASFRVENGRPGIQPA